MTDEKQSRYLILNTCLFTVHNIHKRRALMYILLLVALRVYHARYKDNITSNMRNSKEFKKRKTDKVKKIYVIYSPGSVQQSYRNVSKQIP